MSSDNQMGLSATTMALTQTPPHRVRHFSGRGRRELLVTTRAELPALADLGERAQLLVVWLVSLRSARTRRAYFGDVAVWLDERELDPLTVCRVHVDMWVRAHANAGACQLI
jgi:hypothetical protein